MIADVQGRITSFILENFLYGQAGTPFDPEMSLLDSGIVDSTGVLELVGFLEHEFGLSVPDRDLIPENFETVSRLVAYVGRRSTEPRA